LGAGAVRAATLHAGMLQACADFSAKHDLPIYTHVYETRGQVLIARESLPITAAR
jgi:cytosine/adenosine deaminase-related metal-dependent hydrolase